MQEGRTHTVSSLSLLLTSQGFGRATRKNAPSHFYFLQPSSVLVETFEPKSLLSRQYPLLPFRPDLKLTFAFNRSCAWLYL